MNLLLNFRFMPLGNFKELIQNGTPTWVEFSAALKRMVSPIPGLSHLITRLTAIDLPGFDATFSPNAVSKRVKRLNITVILP